MKNRLTAVSDGLVDVEQNPEHGATETRMTGPVKYPEPVRRTRNSEAASAENPTLLWTIPVEYHGRQLNMGSLHDRPTATNAF